MLKQPKHQLLNEHLTTRMNKLYSCYRVLIILVFGFGGYQPYLFSQDNIPEGYQLLYQQDFSTEKAIDDFEMSDPAAWKVTTDGQEWLELYGESQYKARVRSPFNIALLKDHVFGDFILEANLAQSGREYGHRDLCLFFGAKDATNYYYVHIASVADQNANNIFLVNDAPRTNIATKTTKGTDWGATNSWHKVRIERNVTDGSQMVILRSFSMT